MGKILSMVDRRPVNHSAAGDPEELDKTLVGDELIRASLALLLKSVLLIEALICEKSEPACTNLHDDVELARRDLDWLAAPWEDNQPPAQTIYESEARCREALQESHVTLAPLLAWLDPMTITVSSWPCQSGASDRVSLELEGPRQLRERELSLIRDQQAIADPLALVGVARDAHCLVSHLSSLIPISPLQGCGDLAAGGQ